MVSRNIYKIEKYEPDKSYPTINNSQIMKHFQLEDNLEHRDRLLPLISRYHLWVQTVDRVIRSYLGRENPCVLKIVQDLHNEAQDMVFMCLLCVENRIYFQGRMLEVVHGSMVERLFHIFALNHGIICKTELIEHLYQVNLQDISPRKRKSLYDASNKVILRVRKICEENLDHRDVMRYKWLVYDSKEKTYTFVCDRKKSCKLILV